ncbi:Hypothetical predicted protein, partial [Paramuricea clavata]
ITTSIPEIFRANTSEYPRILLIFLTIFRGIEVGLFDFSPSVMFARECNDFDCSTSTLDDPIPSESGDVSTETEPPKNKQGHANCKAIIESEEKEFMKAKVVMYHTTFTVLKEPPPCSSADDEADAFGKYIVETFKRTVARKKISDMLFNVEIENDQQYR